MNKVPVLEHVREGMAVYDRSNKHVGKVEYVKIGDENPATAQPEAARPSRDASVNPLEQVIADVFSPGELPAEVQSHLLLEGFIRVETGVLFGRDRFVAAHQVAGVSDDKVMLNVNADELAKRD